MNYYNESQAATTTLPPAMVYPAQGIVEGAVPQQAMPPVNPVLISQNTVPMNNYIAEQRDIPPPQQQQQTAPATLPVAEPVEVAHEPEVVEAKPEEAAPPAQPPVEEVVVEENKGPKTFASMFKSKGQQGPPPQMRTKSPIVQVICFDKIISLSLIFYYNLQNVVIIIPLSSQFCALNPSIIFLILSM
jgi:hypothetical protein